MSVTMNKDQLSKNNNLIHIQAKFQIFDFKSPYDSSKLKINDFLTFRVSWSKFITGKSKKQMLKS